MCRHLRNFDLAQFYIYVYILIYLFVLLYFSLHAVRLQLFDSSLHCVFMCWYYQPACCFALPQGVSVGSSAVAMVAVFLRTGGVMGLETARMTQMKLVAVSEITTEQLFCNTRNTEIPMCSNVHVVLEWILEREKTPSCLEITGESA